MGLLAGAVALRKYLVNKPSLIVAMALAWMPGFAGVRAAPQQARKGASPEPLIRRTVRQVVLDVVVTDGAGHPVTGLRADDFTVREDGERQQVLAFDAHNLAGPPTFVPPALPAMPENTFVNLPERPERGPTYLILYDLLNTDVRDQPYARAQLQKFVKGMPEGVRCGLVVLSDGLHLVQGFTQDRETLLAAISDAGSQHLPAIFLQGASYGKGSPLAAVWAFQAIGDYLAGLPGRKNVIWFSGGFPMTLFPNGDNPASSNMDYTAETREVINTLAEDQIAVYPVDVRGVMVDDTEVAAGGDPSDGAGSKPHRTQVHTDVALDRGGLSKRSDDMKGEMPGPGHSLNARSWMDESAVAEDTGGQAFFADNDLEGALHEALEDGGTYYTLTYSPTNRKFDGGLRHIAVRVDQPGYRLAYRRVYFAASNADDERRVQWTGAGGFSRAEILQGVSVAFNGAMQHGAPLMHELVFVARVFPVGRASKAGPDAKTGLVIEPMSEGGRHGSRAGRVQTIAVDYKVMEAAKHGVDGAAGSGEDRLEFAMAAYDRDGLMLNSVVQSAAVPSKAAGELQNFKLHGAEQKIEVPLDAAWLRVGVEDLRSGRIGSLEIPLGACIAQGWHCARP